MRYRAPARGQVDPAVFERMPLAAWQGDAELLRNVDWPSLAALNARRSSPERPHFVAQSPALLADGLHYEQRIATRGEIATRESSWHDLFNALIWLRYPAIKQALNGRQVDEIARMGPKTRSRAQCALTHFDEAGVIVLLRDPDLLSRWDGHDWLDLFWQDRVAWHDGRLQVVVFGHALLEHALSPPQSLLGKALAVVGHQAASMQAAVVAVARAIDAGKCLNDPQELRPLPLSGLPGWHPDAERLAFHRGHPSYQPLRVGRRYPAPISLNS